ncbi:MAG: RnfABCDGE type electron transport complex subunit G [Gammaproteobacteria bacterium]
MSALTARAAPWVLMAVVLAAAALAVATDRWLQPIRERVRGEAVRAMLAGVPMPPYDNDPAVETSAVMRREGASYIEQIYRARRGGAPVGAWLVVRAPGYAGEMRLLIGVRDNGVVTAVRLLSQRETPGYGDRVAGSEAAWLRGFEGRALGNPLRRLWSVSNEGGAFDAVSGATITSRGVVHAVRDALAWYVGSAATASPPATAP